MWGFMSEEDILECSACTLCESDEDFEDFDVVFSVCEDCGKSVCSACLDDFDGECPLCKTSS